MRVKQCQCGGAVVEVPLSHPGPVHCGARGCGERFNVLLHRIKTTDTIRFTIHPLEHYIMTTGIPYDLVMQIVDDLLKEGKNDKLVDVCHEYIKKRTHALKTGSAEEPSKTANEAIARVIRSFEATPAMRSHYEGLASAFKVMRQLEVNLSKQEPPKAKNALVMLPPPPPDVLDPPEPSEE